MSDTRRALLERIDADRDRLIGFLQDFTRMFLHVVRTHTLAAFDYLSRGATTT